MSYKVIPFKANGTIVAPPSKSYAERFLIASALTSGVNEILNAGKSEDVLTTVKALKAMGANIRYDKNGAYTVGKTAFKDKVRINFKESGACMRFLMPVLSALGITYTVRLSKRLKQRPNGELIELLTTHGVTRKGNTFYGKLKSGEYFISLKTSSQYLSGFMFALPLLKGDSKITVDEFKGKGYTDMTKDVLKRSEIEIKEDLNTYYIKGGQKYSLTEKVTVEGDYSAIANFLTLGAYGEKVVIKGLNEDTLQGDKNYIEVLKRSGVNIYYSQGDLTVEGGKVKALNGDFKDMPDLAMAFSVLLSRAEGVGSISGIERLRGKESDRISATEDMLSSASIRSFYDGEKLTVYGGTPKKAVYKSVNDHRIVMAECVLSAISSGTGKVKKIGCVKKSYPEFIKDFERLK